MLEASYIGSAAKKFLECDQSAKITGVTSRGIFLNLPANKIVFISIEPTRGPLTINIGGSAFSQELAINKPGALVEIKDGKIIFPPAGAILDFSNTPVWEPDRVKKDFQAIGSRRQHLADVARRMLAINRLSFFGELIPIIAGSDDGHLRGDHRAGHLVMELRSALDEGDKSLAFKCMSGLLGMGSGLTPSGDDLILGMMLASKRYGEVLDLGIFDEEFIQQIIKLAKEKTGSVSVNLIECASQGLGDERIIRALDGVVTGLVGAAACADLLSGYGSSSGLDVFAGMALVLNKNGDGVMPHHRQTD